MAGIVLMDRFPESAALSIDFFYRAMYRLL